MLTTPQNDLGAAIRIAYAYAPCGVCYVQGKGWALYDLTEGCKPHQADFVYLKAGALPLPLTEQASESLASLIQSRVATGYGYKFHTNR